MEHTHIGKTCPYCQFPIKQDSQVVVCAECRIPHHRECWQENGGCTTFGHQGLRLEVEPGSAEKETQLAKNQAQIRAEAHNRTDTTLVDLQCPVEVVSVKIDASRLQEKAYAAIRFRNLSEKTIIALKLKIICFDVFGEPVMVDGENYFEKKLQDLAAIKGAEFGDEAFFELKGFADTRKVNIQVLIVLFEDYTLWAFGGSPIYEVKVTPLKGHDFKDLQTVAGAEAICYARKEEDYWQCVCGRANILTAVNCVRCGYQMVEAFEKASGEETVTAVIKQIKENRAPYLPIEIDLPSQEVQTYIIDYQHGVIALCNLPIGSRVVDLTWEWVFKNGNNYNGSGVIKAVTWIIVAKDHYDTIEPSVTLFSEELIGRHAFDYRPSWQGFIAGTNHWGDSGTTNNAIHGLRPWLNSTGIQSYEGFYRAFSESFKQAVLETTVPNRKGIRVYSTQDKVFIPSTTELGDTAHNWTYQIGTAYLFFQESGDAKRADLLGGGTRRYWTRSPAMFHGASVSGVASTGAFCYDVAYNGAIGVRPALNLKADTLVSEIRN